MFLLGTDEPAWLRRTTVPLFISRRRLERLRTMPEAVGPWVLDSGGFTELHQFGEWRLGATEYAKRVCRYADEIGGMLWAAPQDWMCEPSALAMSGRTVAEHQRLTVDNFVRLRSILGPLLVPVLQGWRRDDYLRCVDLYDRAGVDLDLEATVGLGSVCRRNADGDIGAIIAALQPLSLHAFGVKGDAYVANVDRLKSADSMAWSLTARHSAPLRGHTHRRCHHCLEYALRWRSRLLERAARPRLFAMP